MDEESNVAVSTIEVTSAFPGAAAAPLSRAERLARRAAFKADDAELALTYVIAQLSGLEMGSAFFRRNPPAERLDAAYVKLTGETAGTSPDQRIFTALFAGREVTAGAVARGVAALLGSLPLRWITASGGNLSTPVTVAELKLLRPARFGGAAVNGRRVATYEADLELRCLVSPPRGATS